MKETLKEKRIRFLLIGFFVLVTIFAFFNRFEEGQLQRYAPRAAVLHESINEQDYAIVALYEFKGKQHVLAVYEIDQTNHYQFKAKSILTLEKAPDELRTDRRRGGVWVLSGNKWSYYTEQLKLMNNAPPADFKDRESFSYNQNTSAIMLQEGQTIDLPKEEKPIELHALAQDSSLWLIVTDTGIKIAAADY